MNDQLILSNIFFTHDSLSQPLFSGLSVTFSPGWTALAGVNGSGKSTLLSLALGRLAPDSGTVAGGDRGVKAAYLGQEMESPPDFFRDPELTSGQEALAAIARLGIGDDWPWRWESLSGGERRRSLIADALLKKPDLLVLDEPTNHIDSAALDTLSSALSTFRGIGILVSHNVAFLDSLCERTVILKRTPRGTVARAYACAPSAAFVADRAEDGRLRGERDSLGAEIARLESRRAAAATEVGRGKKRLSKRGLAPKDHDGKGRVDAARVTGKDAASGAKAARLAAEIARKADTLGSVDAPGSRKTGASFNGSRLRSDFLVRLPAGDLGLAGGAVTITHGELSLGCDARVAITGENGAGKTSLLLELIRRIQDRRHAGISGDSPGRLSFIPQEYDREERERVLRRVRLLGERERAEAISFVYRLGSEPSSILEAEVASPGETKKLALALAMRAETACLVMDEPTNHLDALSAGLLTDALRAYRGALIMVTHDRAFLESLGCEEWRLTAAGVSGGKKRRLLVASPRCDTLYF